MTVGLNIFALIALLFASCSLGAALGFVVCALCRASASAESNEREGEQETFEGKVAG